MQPFGGNGYGPENGWLCPFGGGGAGSPSNTMWPGPRPYLHAKFHLDPSNRLSTIHQRHRQTDRQDRQRSDSIGRTVLQAVAQESVDGNKETTRVEYSGLPRVNEHPMNIKAPFTRYNLLLNRLSNRFDNRVNVCIHDTTGCQTRCQTGLYNPV